MDTELLHCMIEDLESRLNALPAERARIDEKEGALRAAIDSIRHLLTIEESEDERETIVPLPSAIEPVRALRTGRPRTDKAKTDAALELIRGGATIKEAAQKVGVSRNTLSSQVNQRKPALEPCALCNIDADYFHIKTHGVELLKQGKTVQAVASLLKITYGRVAAWKRTAGLVVPQDGDILTCNECGKPRSLKSPQPCAACTQKRASARKDETEEPAPLRAKNVATRNGHVVEREEDTITDEAALEAVGPRINDLRESLTQREREGRDASQSIKDFRAKVRGNERPAACGKCVTRIINETPYFAAQPDCPEHGTGMGVAQPGRERKSEDLSAAS